MSESQVRERIENLKSPVSKFQLLTETGIDVLMGNIEAECEHFKTDADLRIALTETKIVRLASVLTLSAYYHINRAYFHASPGLFAILTAIWGVIMIVVDIVKLIRDSKLWSIAIIIHDLCMVLWEEYRKFVEDVMREVSDVSQQLGMGVDGFSHLLNACEGSVGVIQGIRGIDYQGFKGELYDKYLQYSTYISQHLHELATDPSAVFRKLFTRNQVTDWEDGGDWWKKTAGWIGGVTDRLDKATDAILGMSEEILKFEASLPEFIRNNIPDWITGGLRDMNDYVYYNVKPALAKFDRTFSEIDAVLDSHRKTAADLVDKLAHPGEVLLGIDDLPDYARDTQLAMIDDVTSREFETASESERLAMSGDLEAFDIIQAAMTAPTPEPEFLSMESLGRHELTGIVLDPHETWFVGDY